MHPLKVHVSLSIVGTRTYIKVTRPHTERHDP
jgi:hypothetical protein